MRRRTLARIGENEQFHEIVIHREAGRLDDENILSANALLDHHLDLTIIELPNESLAERDADAFSDILRQFWIRISR